MVAEKTIIKRRVKPRPTLVAVDASRHWVYLELFSCLDVHRMMCWIQWQTRKLPGKT